MEKNDILKWFGITSSTTLPIDTDELINTIINIRDHANTWDNVEQHVKEQSVNLSLVSRNIIHTGGQIIEYINHMPILKRVSDSLNDINESELDEIFYQSDDQQIATELTNILQLIKDDIKEQSIKTSNIKNIISDFRVHITGGYLSNYQHVESLLFNIKGLYNQLETTDNEITDTYLQELLKTKKQELQQLEQEYSHFVKLSFTGLAGGVIGLIITGSIFGSKAEKIRAIKNETLAEIKSINDQINKEELIKKVIFDIQINLHKIDGFFKDARLAVDHLDYMWLVLLTEITQSIEVFKKINNADKLIKFITHFKRIVTSWYTIQEYSTHLITLFEQIQPNSTPSIKGTHMQDKLDLPILPSIDIYQLRHMSNEISAFNKNIIHYDFIIHGKIQKIASKTFNINETIRNSIPKLKIKLNYILKSELNSENTNIPDGILVTSFIEDLIDFKLELERIITKFSYTTDSLSLIHVEESNQHKLQQYAEQKELLVTSKNSKMLKINEINQQHSVITAAEDIILKSKITDFLKKHLLNDELIDSIDMPTNKKQILKSAIAFIKNLLSVIDDGLEFAQLVEVRLDLGNQILELKEEVNHIDKTIFKLSQLMLLSEQITAIDSHKLSIITQIGLIKNYWWEWCHFINEKSSEKTVNIQKINTASQVLMSFLDDMEYQYQRQLPD
ncbi:alpha-xenorhabdolysin family binary toxin subunit A [Providencia hangzhouensis]|uniref:alpha-xenorhabdolysin family binary toxin subunit A n=1 Tax=Providencia hangzhouensis TaxID=3031799 RepID=UPI0034DD4265